MSGDIARSGSSGDTGAGSRLGQGRCPEEAPRQHADRAPRAGRPERRACRRRDDASRGYPRSPGVSLPALRGETGLPERGSCRPPFSAYRSDAECRVVAPAASAVRPAGRSHGRGDLTLMRQRWRRRALGLWLVWRRSRSLTLVIAGVATRLRRECVGRGRGRSGDPPAVRRDWQDAGEPGDRREQAASRAYNDGLIEDHRATRRRPDAFSWTLVDIHAVDIQAVIVMKGGDDGEIYYYLDSPNGTGRLRQRHSRHRSMRAPTAKRYQISHVEFCFDPKGEGGTPTLSVEKTAAAVERIQHSWEIDKQVKVAARPTRPTVTTRR